jgi:serine/threonine protein kinase
MKLCLVCNFQFGDEQDLCPKDMSKLVPLGKDPLIGKLVQERYRVESVIAKGSMGIVYKATQELIGREVAVKVLHGYLVADDESMKRFHKEAKAASRLNHPNIMTLYDFGVLPTGQPYIVMDLLKGKSLADILSERRNLPVDEVLPIFQQVFQAIGAAHKIGVVHRDMKPDNIVVEQSRNKVPLVKLVDFGIATFIQEQEDTLGKITKAGTVCGSPTYMSPEQCDDNRVDGRSDLYSLGVVLYETLTGRVPFDGADIYNVMSMHVKEAPPSLKAVRPDLNFPVHLESVVERALQKDPGKRYQNAADFWEALSNACTNGKSRSSSAPAHTSVTPTPAAAAGVGLGSGSGSGSGAPGGTASGPGVGPGSGPSAMADLSRSMRDPEVPSPTGRGTPGEGFAKISDEDDIQALVDRALTSKLHTAGMTPVSRLTPTPAPPNPAAIINQMADEDAIRKKMHASTLIINKPLSKKKKRRQGVDPVLRWVGFMQQLMPMGLTIILSASLLWVVANEAYLHAVLDRKVKAMFAAQQDNKTDVDALLRANKLDQARKTLEKRRKTGPFTEEDRDNLNDVYFLLARREAKGRRYKAALNLLNQMSDEEKQDEETQILIRKYRRLAGK